MNKLPMMLGTSALALTVALTGCSTNSDSGSRTPSVSESPAATFNVVDEMFVMMMIPHHEQAIEMADIVLAKDGVDPRVSELAAQVKAAQGPEIERMLGWLEDWGIAYDPDSSDGHGMDHGSGDDLMPGDGMMSAEDMTALQDATGAEASRLFLEQMIVHHEGAVDMARMASSGGKNPDVIGLAQQVVDDQTAEIATMKDLLTQL
ncbi:DUF305 domain-containing protein [Leucobacter sp. W1478]|uniref:DUF305 domain-containing protein n=1 Tax=Leucobacter sp. W1478 TaxID=3439065 RepID=UPI003F3CBB89